MKILSSIQAVKTIKIIGMCIALVLAIFGVVMIFMDIQGKTEMSIDTSHVTASVRCLHVGIVCILLAAVIAIIAIFVKYRWTEETTITETPDLTKITTKKQTGMCEQIDNHANSS